MRRPITGACSGCDAGSAVDWSKEPGRGIRRRRGPVRRFFRWSPRLGTFVTHSEVPPTNNTAERALRPFVIWRKLSLHTQAKRGDLFIERILTVVETCRLPGRPVAE